MLCDVYFDVESSMCPWLVAAEAKARFGKVSVGADANHWSHTAYPRASPERTGSRSGVNIPIMSVATVPGMTGRPASAPLRVLLKSITNPLFVAAAELGVVSPNNCTLVAR